MDGKYQPTRKGKGGVKPKRETSPPRLDHSMCALTRTELCFLKILCNAGSRWPARCARPSAKMTPPPLFAEAVSQIWRWTGLHTRHLTAMQAKRPPIIHHNTTADIQIVFCLAWAILWCKHCWA